jgi:hypothetical protein
MSSSSRVTATTVVVGAVASVHARPCSYVEPLRPTVALAVHMADPDGRRDPRAVAAQRLAEERGSLLVLQVPPLADEALLDPPAGLPRWHGGGGLDNTLHFAEWACGAVESVLPPSVVQQLRDFSEGDGAPALLLRGLGVDSDLEGTLVPAATRGYIKRGQRSETWILGLAMLFGDLLQDAEHLLQGGDPGGVGIGHLVPQREKDGTRGPAGSKVPLNLHRDGPFDDLGTFNYVGPESGRSCSSPTSSFSSATARMPTATARPSSTTAAGCTRRLLRRTASCSETRSSSLTISAMGAPTTISRCGRDSIPI